MGYGICYMGFNIPVEQVEELGKEVRCLRCRKTGRFMMRLVDEDGYICEQCLVRIEE